jgi:hypothetical protein
LVFVIGMQGSTKHAQGKSEMNATTVASDLAKAVFRLGLYGGRRAESVACEVSSGAAYPGEGMDGE